MCLNRITGGTRAAPGGSLGAVGARTARKVDLVGNQRRPFPHIPDRLQAHEPEQHDCNRDHSCEQRQSEEIRPRPQRTEALHARHGCWRVRPDPPALRGENRPFRRSCNRTPRCRPKSWRLEIEMIWRRCFVSSPRFGHLCACKDMTELTCICESGPGNDRPPLPWSRG